MDQIWVPITIAVFGNAVAVVIVVVTNRQAVKREESRQDREDDRLRLARDDARLQRARDNHRRVTDLQKDYYLDYYQTLRSTSLHIHNSGTATGPKLESGWNLPAYESLIRLRVFTSDATFVAAAKAYDLLWGWAQSGRAGLQSEQESAFDEAESTYLAAIRHDLGISIDEGRLTADDVLK